MTYLVTSIILCGFVIAVIGAIGTFIWDVQTRNKNDKEKDELCKIEVEFEFKDDFQTLAGIKQHNKESAPFNQVNNFLNKNLIEELKNDFQNSDFPKWDQSIPVSTTKITTISTNFTSDKDPLASVPMSRVSNEAKQKMADIAKEDISKQLEEKTANIHPNDLNAIQTVLGSLNKMNDGDDTKGNTEIINTMIKAPLVKPKRKYNKKPKQ
jgi:hypothetical protein